MTQYFYILTLQATLESGPLNYTASGKADVADGTDRETCYDELSEKTVADMRKSGYPVTKNKCSVVFFYLAPLALT